MDILDIAIAKKLGGGSGVNPDVQAELDKKLNREYGEDNEGKALVVGENGYVGIGDIITTSKTAVTSEGEEGHVELSFIDGADQDVAGELAELQEIVNDPDTGLSALKNDIAALQRELTGVEATAEALSEVIG